MRIPSFARPILCALVLLSSTASVLAQPTFEKSFGTPTIGLGNVSELILTIDNVDAVPADDLAFTDVLPAGMTISEAPTLENTCGGIVTAPPNGDTITLTGGQLGAGADCQIRVDVVGGAVGTLTNTTGDLTSSLGNSGDATADLIVSANRLRFTKSFSPTSIVEGDTSTITFTIENPSGANVFNISFSDSLPDGLEVAPAPGATIDCVGSFAPTPGATTVSFFSGFLPSGATCTLTVDVVANSVGRKENSTSTLSSSQGSAGEANDALVVFLESFNKIFVDDPVAPGQTAELEFTIFNLDRNFAATNITFTDDLDAVLSGLQAVGLPQNDVCGAGSQISGTSVITLTGGNLPAEGSCTFSVTVQVPSTASPGSYTNTTSQLMLDRDGMTVTLNQASDDLIVEDEPILTKSFTDDPVTPGDTVTLEFTIENTSSSAISAIRFTDSLSALFGGTTADTLPAAGFCGAGSTATTFTDGFGERQLQIQNASLAAGDSCTFQVVLQLPEEIPTGTYPNVTSVVTATRDSDAEMLEGDPAEDDLEVVAGPDLLKRFLDDPVAPGDTLTLEFELSHSADAPAAATNISFTDDLDAALTGLVATDTPQSDVCGVGSQLTGTSTLSFSGGTLAPGDTCTFTVTLQVPAGASAGTYTNTTGTVTADVGGFSTEGPPAAAEFLVTGLRFTMEFIDDPTTPGDTVILEYRLVNDPGSADATGIMFTHNLTSTLSGLTSTSPAQTDVCGVGSQISGTTFQIFTGGSLAAGESCSFQIVLQVPATASPGAYGSQTSSLTATIGGSPVVLPPARDELIVLAPLEITKEFIDDPTTSPGMVTLEFTITNVSDALPITNISFTDDLDAVVPGLVASSTPQANVCGTGSSLSGSSTLTLIGGTLAASSSCTFQVTLQVPAGVSPGSVATNTTSQVTGTLAGATVTGSPASDTLLIEFIQFSKQFLGFGAATNTVDLEFTIQNLGGAIGGLSFSDDLDAVLSGLTAISTPQSDVCGAGSQITGTSLLTFTGGNLAAGATCTFAVTLQVPAGAAPGTYPNATSPLTSGGLTLATAATDDLEVEPPPTFAKTFAPDAIAVGQTSTLTFTVDNSASALAASNLSMTDNLPAGLEVAASPNVSITGCSGLGVGLAPGGTTITFTSGSVAAGATCTVSVDVVGTAVGDLTNTTSDLTTSNGNSGSATDTIRVDPQPVFTKSFAPSAIAEDGVSTLTFTIDNSGAANAATGLDFTDDLPSGVVVATPANESTTCAGGTLTANDGAGTISYTGGTVAAGATCTLQVDVTASAAGVYDNTSSALTSSLGSSAPATDTLTVDPAPGFSKEFQPDVIPTGGVSTLVFTIDNTGAVQSADNLDFSDTLPAGVVIAAPAAESTTCTGGTLTAVPGTDTITYTGGSVAAGATCTVQVDVTAAASGTYDNTSSPLTSSLGTSAAASDTLTVDPVPGFAKEFQPDAIAIGGVSTLVFTIDNTGAVGPADALTFSDTLPAGVVVASPSNASSTCTGGTLTATPGSGTITYAGGSVAGGASCTVQVDVTSDTPGTYDNTSSPLTSSQGTSAPASDSLTVDPIPGFSKEFAPDTIAVDEVSTLTFTIDNTGAAQSADALDFTDDLPTGVTVAATPNASTTCTGGTLTATAGSGTISYANGSAAGGASCTVQVDVTSDAQGSYDNTSSPLTSSLGTSPPATDTLTVTGTMLSITKRFATNPILRGGTVTLEFTITNGSTILPATDVSFTDDLDAALLGLEATGLPQTGVCGPGSVVDGTSVIELTGGTIAPSSSCSFTVDVVVPASAPLGEFTNTTSPVTGDLGGVPATGGAASDSAEVAFVDFMKEFLGEAEPGGEVVLRFTLINPDVANSIENLAFVDDLDAVIPGLEAVGLPMTDVCGPGSSIDGTSTITLMDGSLAPGGDCSFEVTLEIPASAQSGTFTNLTSVLSGTVDGQPVSGTQAGIAQADLIVGGTILEIPTLGEWGLLLLGLLLGGAAVRRLRAG